MRRMKLLKELRCSRPSAVLIAFAGVLLSFSCAVRADSELPQWCGWQDPKIMILTSGPLGQRMVYFESWRPSAPQEQPKYIEVEGLQIAVELVEAHGRWYASAAAAFVQKGAENNKGLPEWVVPNAAQSVSVVVHYGEEFEECRLLVPVKFGQAL